MPPKGSPTHRGLLPAILHGARVVKQRHQLFVTLLCISDGLVIGAAAFLAWAIRRHLVETFWPDEWESFVKGPFLLFAVPITLVTLWSMGLYRARRDRSLWSEQGEVFKAAFIAIAAILIVLWAIGEELISGEKSTSTGSVLGHPITVARIQLGALAILLPTFLGLHRAVFRLSLRFIRRRGWNLRHVAIIGTGRLGQITCRTLERNSWTGINVAYFLSHHEKTKRTACIGRPVPGGLDDLERILDSQRVDAVYLAIPSARSNLLANVLRRLERFPLDVRIIPDAPPRFLSQSMSVSELDGMPILSYRECPLYGVGGFTTRLLDIVGSALGLILLTPFLLLAAAAVRLSGPGPVVFKQRRVSLAGEEFNIYKFRTMADVQDEPQTVLPSMSDRTEPSAVPGGWTHRNDPRITPVGRWLRGTSIDELPQLFNVFKGEMSLVGPRPERPELIKDFRENWRGYMLRQHVKAGMTGWAQVNGHRGSTSLKKRLQYDLFYIRHWSVGFDLRILWLTLFRGFVHKNAH